MDNWIMWLKSNWLPIVIVIWFIVFYIRGGRWKKLRKINAGPIGMEIAGDEAADCPHVKCHAETKAHITKLWEKVDRSSEKLLNDFELIKEIKSEIDRLVEIVEEISIDQLKLVFYNPEMEETERLIAGLRYVSRDKNHQMKIDVKEFCIAHPVVYRAAVAAAPKLRFAGVEEALKNGKE